MSNLIGFYQSNKPMLFLFRRTRSRNRAPNASGASASGPDQTATWRREDLLTLLSVSSTLAGLCITSVSLINGSAHRGSGTLADDGMTFSALLFLLCTYAVFFALRTRHARWARWLDRVVDALFMLALTGMVVCGFLLVYTVL